MACGARYVLTLYQINGGENSQWTVSTFLRNILNKTHLQKNYGSESSILTANFVDL